jgi:hypothetical protein
VVSSQRFLGSDHGFNTIVHVLDQLDLVSSESSQVGDVEDTIVGLGVLTVDTSDLDVVLVGNRLMKRCVLHQFWQVNVHGSSKSCSHVGWASGDITKMLVIGELGFGLDDVGSIGESLENRLDIGSSLHGDDSKLILFVDPDEESLGVIVVDTSSLGPLSLKTSRLKIFIATLEKEVISDKGSLLSLGHGGEGVILSLKVTGELSKSICNKLLDLESLGSGNGSTKWVSSEVSGNSNSSGVDHLVLISWEWWAVQFVVIHGRDVLVSWLVTVVSLDDLVHEWGEGIVRVVGSSVNSDTGVGPFTSREDALSETESEFIFSILALLPNILGKALLEEGSCSCWEEWESFNILWGLEMRSHHSSIEIAFGNA